MKVSSLLNIFLLICIFCISSIIPTQADSKILSSESNTNSVTTRSRFSKYGITYIPAVNTTLLREELLTFHDNSTKRISFKAKRNDNQKLAELFESVELQGVKLNVRKHQQIDHRNRDNSVTYYSVSPDFMIKHGNHFHRASETEQNAGIIFLALILLFMVSHALHKWWKEAYPQSYEQFTLLGLWIIPCILAIYLGFYRFIVVWAIFSVVTAGILRKAFGAKVSGNVPREVYSFFLYLYKLAYCVAILGYVVLLLDLFGITTLLGLSSTYALPEVQKQSNLLVKDQQADQTKSQPAVNNTTSTATAPIDIDGVDKLTNDVIIDKDMKHGEIKDENKKETTDDNLVIGESIDQPEEDEEDEDIARDLDSILESETADGKKDITASADGSNTNTNINATTDHATTATAIPGESGNSGANDDSSKTAVVVTNPSKPTDDLFNPNYPQPAIYRIRNQEIAVVEVGGLRIQQSLKPKVAKSSEHTHDNDGNRTSSSKQEDTSSGSSWLGAGFILMFYGVYFGLLGRDISSVATEKMATTIGYYTKPVFHDKDREKNKSIISNVINNSDDKENIESTSLQSHRQGNHGSQRLDDNTCAICDGILHPHLSLEAREAGINPTGFVEKVHKLSCGHEFHDFCLRGWLLVGKRDTCAYCHEKATYKDNFTTPWEKQHVAWSQFLDVVRFVLVFNPIIIFTMNIFLLYFY